MNNNTIANITVDELHEYVSLMASKIAKMTVEENSVVTGTITSSAGNNYTIQLKTSDSQSSARPLTDGVVYNVGDYVYLIRGAAAIEGGESPSYFIFGRVDDTKIALANASDLERFTSAGMVQENVVSGTVYDKDSGVFWDALKNYKALKIEGKFNTVLDVGVTVTYKDKDGEIKEEFKLDSAWMQGQPSNMQGLPQQRVIERTKELTDDDTVAITVIEGAEIKLTAGTLNKYLKDFSLEVKPTNKSYFRNELPEKLEEDIVRLEAKLKYLDGAINSGVQYYWFVEMPEGVTAEHLATEDKDQVNDLIGGDRWYCLNSYNDCNVVGQEEKIRIWNKSDNFIVLDKFKYLHKIDGLSFDSLNQIPLKFINKIKCVAVYEGFYINSEVFELVDYSKESFTIEISANQRDLSLVTEDSEIILTCEVKQENEMIGKDKFSYSYLWVIDGKTEFKVKKGTADNYIEEEIQYTWPTLKLKDTLSNIYADNTYDLTDEKVTVKCRVGIDGSDVDTISDYYEDSNELTITSFVLSESTINEYIFYKYLISGVNETFTSKLENGYLDWSSATSVANNIPPWIPDPNLANWTGDTSDWPLTGATGAAARAHLNTVTLSNDQYLYYTTKSVWIEEKLDYELTGDQRYIKIKEGDWSLPRMLRGVTENGNNLSEGAVNKINTFNDLTNGGKEQGFYLKDVYYSTEDESPQKDKTYYLFDGDNYIKQTNLQGFTEGLTYYEYEPSKLFINAEFIQTGALKVADENGNSIFYADIDQKKVEIGGFTVNDHSINNSNNVKDDTKQIYIGQDYVKFGTNFNYDVDSGELDITGVGADYLIIKNDDGSTAFYASNDNSKQPEDVPDGAKVYAQNLASISGEMGTLTAGEIFGKDRKWSISTEGDYFINAKSFKISHQGDITANSGVIGNLSITQDSLIGYAENKDSNNNKVVNYIIDSQGIRAANNFYIFTGPSAESMSCGLLLHGREADKKTVTFTLSQGTANIESNIVGVAALTFGYYELTLVVPLSISYSGIANEEFQNYDIYASAIEVTIEYSVNCSYTTYTGTVNKNFSATARESFYPGKTSIDFNIYLPIEDAIQINSLEYEIHDYNILKVNETDYTNNTQTHEVELKAYNTDIELVGNIVPQTAATSTLGTGNLVNMTADKWFFAGWFRNLCVQVDGRQDGSFSGSEWKNLTSFLGVLDERIYAIETLLKSGINQTIEVDRLDSYTIKMEKGIITSFEF